MKKIVLVLMVVLSLCLLSGCGKKSSKSEFKITPTKTMTCTASETDANGNKTEEEVIISYEGQKIVEMKVSTTIVADDEIVDYYEDALNKINAAFNQHDGIKASYLKLETNKYKLVFDIIPDKINIEELKEGMKEYYEEDDLKLFDTKDVTLDTFKKEYIAGYTCK